MRSAAEQGAGRPIIFDAVWMILQSLLVPERNRCGYSEAGLGGQVVNRFS